MRHILFLLAFFSAPAFAAERAIVNPDSNGDLKIKVNVGGTVTDALTVTGSTGAVTVGNPVSWQPRSLAPTPIQLHAPTILLSNNRPREAPCGVGCIITS